MEIDIISFTDEQYAALTESQIVKVQEMQLEKSRLDRQLEKDMLAEKHRLLDAGVFLSGIWEAYCEKLRAEHAQEVEALRDSLLFYLRFVVKPETGETSPYVVDYSLSMEERFIIVKTYYEETYPNEYERFNEFKKDEIALQYLGEYYRALYDYFEPVGD